MFGMALNRPSLTMQLTSGMDVFAHAYGHGQKADIANNYCDNIQPYDNRRYCFVKCDTNLDFFLKLPQLHTSNSRKDVRQHTEGMVELLRGFRLKFIWLSSSERILKIC